MADQKMPDEMIAWMRNKGWGPHHKEWHYIRRWDFWPALANSLPDPQQRNQIAEMVRYATDQGWMRAALQEGAVGSGLDFLAMHRAMFMLLQEDFPDAGALLRGWSTPPQDPLDVQDRVPDGSAFDPAKADAVRLIEDGGAHFADDDAFGLFLETNLRPSAADPTARSPDARLGLHNYLHNRWADGTSEVDLGNPEVNIFNQRFWRLHGWIDAQWERFRRAKGSDDNDPAYVALIEHYRHMMAGHGHGHGHGHGAGPAAATARPQANFGNVFRFDR